MDFVYRRIADAWSMLGGLTFLSSEERTVVGLSGGWLLVTSGE